MSKLLEIIGMIIIIIIIALVICVITALPIMILWNWLMPAIFKLPEIDFWQALGMSILSAILFKSYSYHNNKE